MFHVSGLKVIYLPYPSVLYYFIILITCLNSDNVVMNVCMYVCMYVMYVCMYVYVLQTMSQPLSLLVIKYIID